MNADSALLPLGPLHCVVASTAADAVLHAGGWLFDQAASGWKTSAILLERGDETAFAILGARPIALETASEAVDFDTCPLVLVVSAVLYEVDSRVRGLTDEAMRNDHAEVLFWGRAGGERPAAVEHRLSRAAQVFKSAALQATGRTSTDAAGFETFFALRLRQPADAPR
jgi:hypothetical protein